MSEIPAHAIPRYSADATEDALFHYTNANGLIGIFRDRDIWATAYHCANDESELGAGKGILQSIFRAETARLINAGDDRVRTFHGRGVDAMEYADKFEDLITSFALSSLSTFITCFCRPNKEEDFHHGLLSQWRGYGSDGGYALQFSRRRLSEAIARTNDAAKLNYELQDVHYTSDNTLKEDVLTHTGTFVQAYVAFLDQLARPIGSQKSMPNPVAPLLRGPLEAYLDYLIHTKNKHFDEERECRLSLIKRLPP
jgi:hypothetical protein